MRRLSLLLGTILVSVSISGCTSDNLSRIEQNTETNTIFNTELPEVEQNTSEEEENATVKYTQEKYDALQTYLKSYNYADITQIVENGYISETNDTYIKTEYKVRSDTTSNIAFMHTIKTDENGDFSEEKVVRNFENMITCRYDESKQAWREVDGEVTIIAWNLTDFENDWDLYNFLVQGFELPIDKEGSLVEDYEYYEIITKADASSLVNVKYDKLGNQTLTYIFQNLDGVSIPRSVTVRIDYTIGQTDYYISSTIQFNDFGNTVLELPEYLREVKSYDDL